MGEGRQLLAMAASNHLPSGHVLLELGAVLFGLGLLGLLAHRLRVSPVPLYLLAGLAFNEHGVLPLAAREEGRQFIEVGAELGAVLLLLGLELEYSADELVAGLRHNRAAGFLDLVLNAAPGAALALLLGRGEFSIIIAGLTTTTAAGAGLIALDQRSDPLAAAYVLLLAVTGPLLARLLEALTSHRRPHPTGTSASARGSEKPGSAGHHHGKVARRITGSHAPRSEAEQRSSAYDDAAGW